MSNTSTPGSGWIGFASGTIFAILCTFVATGLQMHRRYFTENLSWKITDEKGCENEEKMDEVINKLEYLWAKPRRYKIMLVLLLSSGLPFLGGLAAHVSYEHSFIAALGMLFVMLPLVVMYFWNLFNEQNCGHEDPYHANRRLVASLLPLERAVGIGIVELLGSHPDIQLVVFFVIVTLFLLVMLVGKPHNERNDFFNELALRCSVAVVSAVAVDMHFDLGMAGPREASASLVAVAGVLWVLVALGPFEIPRALLAQTRSAFRHMELEEAISNGDMKRAADLLLDSDPGIKVKMSFLRGAEQAEFKDVNPKASFLKERALAEAFTVIHAVAKLAVTDDEDDDVYTLAEEVLAKWMTKLETFAAPGDKTVIDLLVKLAQNDFGQGQVTHKLRNVKVLMAKALGNISLPGDQAVTDKIQIPELPEQSSNHRDECAV
eukprot:gnl/MRDRNA2_/MRDRNA2_67991_c0_seq1.p1 gnl/MRDRNA2_/MRDRNA2_67991_c0~~gnl/MRDRNA2_/MRDRNA2_67991_c0_seq1.p1  ORF type:complete len:434 (-),score=97.25 gnl/MRDRNA2_/MRDRNA2_67991_c0_seq1:45-1346(-)